MLDSSPAACRFAIRDKTVFCFLLSGLLNIDSALTLIRFAGRDDADGFFFAIFILHAIYVDDQQQRPLYGSNAMPPLFASHDAVLTEHRLGIVENECRNLERDATVLQLVDPILLAVPFESHRYTNCITFTGGSQRFPNELAPLSTARRIPRAAYCSIARTSAGTLGSNRIFFTVASLARFNRL